MAIPTEQELRQIFHDKYMAYDKEQLVGYLVDLTMIYAQRHCLPSNRVNSIQSMINEIQQATVVTPKDVQTVIHKQ